MLSRRRIEDIMMRAGIPVGARGFNYIADAILMIDSDEKKDYQACKVYEEIAKLHGNNAAQVERAIRIAFSTAEKRGDAEVVSHYIGEGRKTNWNRIKNFYVVLKHEEEDSVEHEEFVRESISGDVLRKIVREEIRAFLLNAAREGAQDV